MRIGMVLTDGNGFPPDIRIEKESRALSQAGHEVFILARKTTDTLPETELIHELGVTVVRADVPGGSKFSKALFALMVHDFHWKKPIDRFVKDNNIQVLHVHDLEGVPAVLRIARRYGIPVVADLHENMPAAMRAYRSVSPVWKRVLEGLLWNYHWMRFKEASALRECERTIVVVPEAAKRVHAYGIPHKKVVVVSNTEDESTFNFDITSADPTITNAYKKSWVASYIGGIGPHRGIDTTLKAVSKLHARIPGFRLLIVGVKNKDVRAWLKRELEKLKIDEIVEIIGWQPFAKVNSYIMASDVCLVPHNDFEHTQTTVPHKLFQYMICQKPVLVSDCDPLKRIVDDSKGGVVFTANDSLDMADKLAWMYRHPEDIKNMGQRGQKAALGKYSWQNDAKNLMRMYAELEPNCST